MNTSRPCAPSRTRMTTALSRASTSPTNADANQYTSRAVEAEPFATSTFRSARVTHLLEIEATREMERRQIAEGLRDLLAVVNSSRSLSDILDRVVTQAGELLGSAAGAVYLQDDDQPDH